MAQRTQIQLESVERLEREARQTLVALQRTLTRAGQDTAELSALRVQLRSYLRAVVRKSPAHEPSLPSENVSEFFLSDIARQ